MTTFVYVHLFEDRKLRLSVFGSLRWDGVRKLSNTFDLPPEQALTNHAVRVRRPVSLGLSCIDSQQDGQDIGFTFVPRPSQHRIVLSPLCEFAGDQVYAVCVTDAIAEYVSAGYEAHEIYDLATVAKLHGSFTDADLFLAILPMLDLLEKKHAQEST